MLSLSHVQLFVTPWTVAFQALQSMDFSRQEYWSGFYFLLQGTFLSQALNSGPLQCKQILFHLGFNAPSQNEAVHNPFNAMVESWLGLSGVSFDLRVEYTFHFYFYFETIT